MKQVNDMRSGLNRINRRLYAELIYYRYNNPLIGGELVGNRLESMFMEMCTHDIDGELYITLKLPR